jgi:hypothetical protein
MVARRRGRQRRQRRIELRRRRFQEAASLFVLVQQRLDPLSQPCIRPARLTEPCRPLVASRFVQRLEKNALFVHVGFS